MLSHGRKHYKIILQHISFSVRNSYPVIFSRLCKKNFGNPYAYLEISLTKPRNTPKLITCVIWIHSPKSGHTVSYYFSNDKLSIKLEQY